MTTTMLTPGELRTNAQKITDEEIKERVLRGIAVLEEQYGPEWVDKIDLATLNLQSGSACVLGQVYAGAEVTTAQWEAYYGTSHFAAAEADGYVRGLAILDGDVAEAPEAFGFEVEDAYDHEWARLQAAWETALGGAR